MRVISLIGRDAGQEVILPVPVAEAMLADGRAKPVPDRADYSDLERRLATPAGSGLQAIRAGWPGENHRRRREKTAPVKGT